MAFHQTTRQATQRAFRPAADEEHEYQAPTLDTGAVEDSQTWVLFSPATDAETSTSYLTETHQSQITPGRSRISDLGSLNTVARSEVTPDQLNSATFLEAEDEESGEDDAELDSLDSHLPEFRSTPNFFSSANTLQHAPVLPAHDGLGSFRLDKDGTGADMQDRLYAFEQYNPRRVKRRRESLELAQLQIDAEKAEEDERTRRIESWRLEHSRYLVDEIQKESRRRRRPAAGSTSTRTAERPAGDATTLGSPSSTNHEQSDQGESWHDQHASDIMGDRESTWGRITRKVIRDLMGIDDKLLSVLFGEALPDMDDLSATPKASSPISGQGQEEQLADGSTESNWQLRVLERIARELGLFVHQLSEHPGAFSTFSRVQHMPIAYAGLPSIPETSKDPETKPSRPEASTMTPEFQPTVRPQSRPMDIPHAQASIMTTETRANAEGHPSAGEPTFTQEEWEQDLDVRLVFRYLRSRFMSQSTSTGGLNNSPHLNTSSNQDLAAKAARVRQHHPLVSKARPVERRTFKATTPTSPVLFRPASSCASQSTRRSVRRSSTSSRHYWDIGGSVGTGSLIATTGPMGSWGEV